MVYASIIQGFIQLYGGDDAYEEYPKLKPECDIDLDDTLQILAEYNFIPVSDTLFYKP